MFGTRHPLGIIKFKDIDRKAMLRQDEVKEALKEEARELKSGGQQEMFSAEHTFSKRPTSFLQERQRRLLEAECLATNVVAARSIAEYDDVCASLLEIPYVWEEDVRQILHRAKAVRFEGLGPRQTSPQPGTGVRVVWKGDGRA
ncbi:MAG: hypothetical protein R3B89_24790 [Polyangiaceae bacterium]